MKKLINPTTYFFQQAEEISSEVNPEIQLFTRSLFNQESCELCKGAYDIEKKIPRILIHCGHTFCSQCLKEFYMNRRVRCPMCLKLVKYFDSLNRLPINHTIFTKLVQNHQKKCAKEKIPPKIESAQTFLFAEFQRVQKEAHREQNGIKMDPSSGLPFCAFHPDRVEHFFCKTHKTNGCRVCREIGHSKSECDVIDLYTVDDPEEYLRDGEEENFFQKRIGQHQIPGNLVDDDDDEDDDDEDSIRSI